MATGELGMLSLLKKYNKARLSDNFSAALQNFRRARRYTRKAKMAASGRTRNVSLC